METIIFLETKLMKSSQSMDKERDKMMVDEHGKAIALAMEEHKIQKEKDMAKAAKRKQTMLKRAADIMFQ